MDGHAGQLAFTNTHTHLQREYVEAKTGLAVLARAGKNQAV
jgi:hypothetical protein